MRADVVSLLALLATVVSVVVVLPQVWRTCRHGHVGGVAVGHVWLAAVTSAVWVQFALATGSTGAAVCSVLTGALNTVLLVGLARALPAVLRQAARVVPATAAWLAVHGALLAAGEVALVAGLTAAGSIAASVPQVAHMLRRPDLDLSGVSAASWRFSALTHACWLGHWVLQGEGVLVVAPAVGVVAAVVVLALLGNARVGRRHPVLVLGERRARMVLAA